MDSQASHPTVFPVKAPAYPKDKPYGYKDKNFGIDPRFMSNGMGSDFVIEPRFKTSTSDASNDDSRDEEEVEEKSQSRVEEEPVHSLEEHQSEDSYREEVGEVVVPIVDKRIRHELEAGKHGDDERRSILSSSESSSSSVSSSSLSSSSSSTSSLTSSE